MVILTLASFGLPDINFGPERQPAEMLVFSKFCRHPSFLSSVNKSLFGLHGRTSTNWMCCSGTSCFILDQFSRMDSSSSHLCLFHRCVQTCRMSSTGGGTGLTQRNYRLASDTDKPRTTGTTWRGTHTHHICKYLRPVVALNMYLRTQARVCRMTSLPLPVIVNRRMGHSGPVMLVPPQSAVICLCLSRCCQRQAAERLPAPRVSQRQTLPQVMSP